MWGILKLTHENTTLSSSLFQSLVLPRQPVWMTTEMVPVRCPGTLCPMQIFTLPTASEMMESNTCVTPPGVPVPSVASAGIHIS